MTETLTGALARTGATLELTADASGARAVARTRLPSGSTNREVEARHEHAVVAAIDAVHLLDAPGARREPAGFRWLLEVEVDPDLGDDGLELENFEHRLHTAYPRARTSGLRARVVEAPDPDAVARAQGWIDARHKREGT